jgi:hypothetical protein
MKRFMFVLIIGTVLLFPLRPFSQTVPATQTVSPDAPKGWLDLWREATVSIGRVDEAEVVIDGVKSKKKIFIPVGTGIVFKEDDNKTLWLVTAKHVFDDAENAWHPKSIQIRFSWFDAKSVDDYLGVTVGLQQDGKRLWTAHSIPEVDIACVRLIVSASEVGRQNMISVSASDLAGPKDYYAGTSVIVLGYPGAVGQNFWNRALARQGMIAWVAPSDPDKNPFLVDR